MIAGSLSLVVSLLACIIIIIIIILLVITFKHGIYNYVPETNLDSRVYSVATLREERKLRVFENMVLRRIFGPRRDEVTRGMEEIA